MSIKVQDAIAAALSAPGARNPDLPQAAAQGDATFRVFREQRHDRHALFFAHADRRRTAQKFRGFDHRLEAFRQDNICVTDACVNDASLSRYIP